MKQRWRFHLRALQGSLSALCLVALVAGRPAQAAPLDEVQRHIVREYERIGRRAPALDPALTEAANTVARRAVARSAAQASELLFLTRAISDAGGHDAGVRAIVVRGSPAAEPLRRFLERTDFNDEPASHVGAAVVSQGDATAVVALFAERKVALDRFDRTYDYPGLRPRLCGELDSELARADLFVTRPSGKVEQLRAAARSGRFCVDVPLPSNGRHTLELLAHGARGPEVVALLFAQVGERPSSPNDEETHEPTEGPEARATILARVNALREGLGASPVLADADLDRVAQAYAERMALEGFFAHIAPDGSDLRARLADARYGYQTAGENLGMASGPLSAHFGIEHSPGHRKNLLDAKHQRLGVGIAQRTVSGSPQTLVVEILAQRGEAPAPTTSGDPRNAAYRALDAERSRRKLPALRRSKPLEALAQSHAEKALALGQPTANLAGEKLHDKLFKAVDGLESAAIDLFVTENPALVTSSKNLVRREHNLVAVGVSRGDSLRFGPSKFWVVIIYASKR